MINHLNQDEIFSAAVIFHSHDRETVPVEESEREIRSLSATAGFTLQKIFIQNLRQTDQKFFLGKGKAAEIQTWKRDNPDVSVLVVDHDLSPSQSSNLSDFLELRVLNRTELIITIFSKNASSKQTHYQVEAARLRYMMSRLTGKGVSMSRIEGGIGMRGPGEKKLETDRRNIRRRLHELEKKLEKIKNNRKIQRKRRLNHEFNVSIVGYTNSGKSTLLNTLTRSDVLEEDRLFATLDTTSRKWWIGGHYPEGSRVVLTDTVGFIRNLPHLLVDSFYSSLEELIYSDLLIHVSDISSPHSEYRMKVVNETLEELGASEIEKIICLNKTDLLSEQELMEYRLKYPEALLISAGKELNIDILEKEIKVICERRKNGFK